MRGKTTIGPKMETMEQPPKTEAEHKAAPGPGKEQAEEEEEEEMQMPQTPFTTPAAAVAAAAGTSQGATKAPFAAGLYHAGGGPVSTPSREAAGEAYAQVRGTSCWVMHAWSWLVVTTSSAHMR